MKIEEVNVFQIGARDAYQYAVIFSRLGLLGRLFTDVWVHPSSLLSAVIGSKSARRFSGGVDPFGVNSYSVCRWLIYELVREKDVCCRWVQGGQRFCRFVLAGLDVKSIKKNTLLWGYTLGAAEVFEKGVENENVVNVLNQFDPGIEYYERLARISLRMGSRKQIHRPPSLELVFQRLRKEWELADVIVVNSDLSARSLVKHGVDGDKIVNIPLAYCGNITGPKTQPNRKKLCVCFVGTISFIKGFHVFAEVAKRLRTKINFFAAGSEGDVGALRENCSKYVTFVGQLNREEMDDFYERMDVLIFPSLCDGFGMVQLEAMARGIPVIASEDCAKVVRNGIDGFIVSGPDVDKYADHVRFFDDSRQCLRRFGCAAVERVTEFSKEAIKNKMIQEFRKKGYMISEMNKEGSGV